jgi:hypothetical protein
VNEHFSAVDSFTRAEVHTKATAKLAAGFLAQLIAHTSFPIRAVQVDGKAAAPGLGGPGSFGIPG